MKRINPNLPSNVKIDKLSDQIIELSGAITSNKFDEKEINHIYQVFDMESKYRRSVPLGTTIDTYYKWIPTIVKGGYTIWKYQMSQYEPFVDNVVYFDGKPLKNRGVAQSEDSAYFLSTIVYDDITGNYLSYTDAAKGGGNFTVLEDINKELLFCTFSGFDGFSIKLNTKAVGANLKLYYWNFNQQDWAMVPDEVILENSLGNMDTDFGYVRWTLNSYYEFGQKAWTNSTINGVVGRWIKIVTTSAPSTIPEVNTIIPIESSVSQLLTLSGIDLLNEDYAFCTYQSSTVPPTYSVYVTIRNEGNPYGEGEYYIKSDSSDENKKNFFMYNHKFTADYLNSQYIDDKNVVFDGTITASDFKGGGIEGKKYAITSTGLQEIVENGITRGSFVLNDLNYTFTITTPSIAPTIGAIYTNNSMIYTVVSYSDNVLVCSGGGYPESSGTLVKYSGTGDAELTFSSHKTTLKITHNLTLSMPYTILGISVFDNNGKQVEPDEVKLTGTDIIIDLTSKTTLTGTNGYIFLKG